jgi:alpha-amylase/alpha-mannosidase (GH57 family)
MAVLVTGCNRNEPKPTPTAVVELPTPTPVAPTPTEAPAAEPTATPTEAPPAAEEPIYLSIIWHQHQPVYFKDPATGIYQKPWVRLHAAKDYVDMAAILKQYPSIKATFNLTPSLLQQLLDLEAGAQDLYEVYTLIPPEELTDEQKQFIHDRFFDVNPKIIARFPRYQEIAGDRANWENWDAQTWLDLQVLFNLAWTDPDWLAQEPLASLVAKGRDYAPEDRQIVLDEHRRLVSTVIPLHKQLQDDGRIEITTTPFYHPILPLLVDTNLARIAVPDMELPNRFTYGIDAVEQTKRGVAFYKKLFDRDPRGMWPAEGAVAQEIVGIVGREGIQWMASDEEVLARSLGKKAFSRNAEETVLEADALYRPYIVRSRSNQLYTIFRDKVISDKVGFTYSGSDGLEAAQDFVQRILAIREQLAASGAEGPHLVSVILDGENAWEHYPNDGKKFLNSLYQLLEEEQARGAIQTITPSEFIHRFPDQPAIDELWAGSWVSPDYLTWMGEPEENRAWNYLNEVRTFVRNQQRNLDEETLSQVMDAIYTAEGSDWFWWYGADQNSGDDASFDLQFRLTLQRVYQIMGKPVPTFLKIPIIPERTQPPAAGVSGLVTPEIDGVAAEGEWDNAGYYLEEGGVQANPNQVISQLWYGFDTENLYLRLDGRRAWADVADETRIGFYLTRAGSGGEQFFSRVSMLNQSDETLLGFGANALVEVVVNDAGSAATLYFVSNKGEYLPVVEAPVGVSGNVMEIALPYADFGKPDAGDVFKLRVVVSEDEQRDIQMAPGAGPAELVAPDLGLTIPVLAIADPTGDDYGPGSYTYPQDAVFKPHAFDITEFAVAEDDNNLIFRFNFAGELNNDWGAPNGMGIHTLDVYIDVDGPAAGERKLLPGRNAAVTADYAWDIAIWAEGWTPGLYGPPSADSPDPVQIGDRDTLNIVSDPGQRKITVRVAKSVLAEALGVEATKLDPASWNYLGIVLSQEGFPSSGVWRVRDVNEKAEQWRLGGAPRGSNIHPRIIDVAYPDGFVLSQEEALSSFTPRTVSAKEFDQLSADEFAQLPMISAN